MSHIPEELPKDSTKIKLSKISQELKNIQNKINAHIKKNTKVQLEVQQEISVTLENILKKINKIKEEASQ